MLDSRLPAGPVEVVGAPDGVGIDGRPLVGLPEGVRNPPARCLAYVVRHRGSIRPRRRIAFSEILCRVAMSERRFDTGDKLGYLEANVTLALEDPALGAELKEFLRSKLED